MHLHAGLGFIVMATAVQIAVAHSAPPAPVLPTLRLAGEWIGEVRGELVSWKFEDAGRAHLNGRFAMFTVAHDTLRVTFEAPLRAASDVRPEVAVYRFLASDPGSGPARLFVYGFDLGKQGVWLQPAIAAAPLAEDAAPPVPEPTGGDTPNPTPPSPAPPAAGNGHAAAVTPNPPRP